MRNLKINYVQVRIEGVAKEMPMEFTRASFRTWSMRTKVRYGFSKQGNEIDWDELKKRHDEYVKHLSDAKEDSIDMPAEV